MTRQFDRLSIQHSLIACYLIRLSRWRLSLRREHGKYAWVLYIKRKQPDKEIITMAIHLNRSIFQVCLHAYWRIQKRYMIASNRTFGLLRWKWNSNNYKLLSVGRISRRSLPFVTLDIRSNREQPYIKSTRFLKGFLRLGFFLEKPKLKEQKS